MSTPYLDAILKSISPQYSTNYTNNESIEALIRFAVGGECPENATTDTKAGWSTRQTAYSTSNGKKRDSSAVDVSSGSNKRVKVDPEGAQQDAGRLIASLGAVSLSAPVRKKLDIEIHEHGILLVSPASKAVEAPMIPIKNLGRTFVLPTRGKATDHWTVAILSGGDFTPLSENSKKKDTVETAPQIVFGIDAITTGPLSLLTPASTTATKSPKGTESQPLISKFLESLPVSAIVVSDVSNSVDAFQGAKSGAVYFTPQGIVSLFKPVEFWSLPDIVPGEMGVRMLSATGRNCSVIVSRKLAEEDDEDDEEAVNAVETEFAMIDGKEQDKIRGWVAKQQRKFGISDLASTSAAQQEQDADDSDHTDESDDSFDEDSDDDDGGSATSESEDDEEAGGEESDEEEEEEEDLDGLRADAGDIDDLDPRHHPLLRPGAMPKKISAAALQMVVGMVEDDMMGTDRSGVIEIESEDDELDD